MNERDVYIEKKSKFIRTVTVIITVHDTVHNRCLFPMEFSNKRPYLFKSRPLCVLVGIRLLDSLQVTNQTKVYHQQSLSTFSVLFGYVQKNTKTKSIQKKSKGMKNKITMIQSITVG